MAKDFYQTLGVAKGASETEIKKAYRKLVQKHHPDRKGGDESKFKEVSEAYEVLSDPKKRGMYDQFGSAAFNQYQEGVDPRQHYGGAPGGNPFAAGGSNPFGGGQGRYSVNFDTENINVEDILGSIFGGGQAGPRRTASQGADIQVTLPLSLQEAFTGTSKGLRVHNKSYKVKIPPGARDGSRIRFRGEGESSPGGGATGDLFFVVQITPDPRFERMGDDLLSTRHINYPTAALGGSVEVDTIEGLVHLKIPAGTQNDSVIRLSGKGMPRAGSKERGDQLVRILVEVPKHLSARQKELLKELEGTLRG